MSSSGSSACWGKRHSRMRIRMRFSACGLTAGKKQVNILPSGSSPSVV